MIEALGLGQSASTIEAAVGARSWSAAQGRADAGEALYQGLAAAAGEAPKHWRRDLEQALLAAKIIAYSQGFSLLDAASQEYNWSLDMGQIAEIWREGCIIRSAMLDDMAQAARDGHAGRAVDLRAALCGDPEDGLAGFAARGCGGGPARPAGSGVFGGAGLFRHDARRGAARPT